MISAGHCASVTRSTEVLNPGVCALQVDTPVQASISPDGSVFVSVPKVVRTGCSMNLTTFPFDRQHCSFTIGEQLDCSTAP